ncbi:CDF family Co(II)/Ni(II) efflux transporter DmeF [Azospirillum sp. ST 5-10]|uniref:CDF family Co(II)/Ni(II) efflux transporter DmeF n=1 Tax=unclassified Azospirillum TaxID=2630922 RepID=UPI003F4A5EBD
MHTRSIERWRHDHSFGQDATRPGERRTRVVVALTGATMVVEVAAGWWTGSMALLADGVHMASHMLALGIAIFAYAFARRHAHDPAFSFGTGKVTALGGFAGALMLAVVAAGMAWHSVARLLQPEAIAVDEAVAVAVLGLIVNAASVVVLGGHGHAHGHAHDDDHDHQGEHHHDHHHGHEDHNLRSAYLHVLADALTSVLAIVALLGAKYADAGWLDPAMGIVGSLLIAQWSRGLLRDTAHVLLDRQLPEALQAAMRAALEQGDDRVADLHVWSIAPGGHAAIVSIVTSDPRPVEEYRRRVPAGLNILHLSVEVHRCG